MASVRSIRTKFQDLPSQKIRRFQENLKSGWRQSAVPSFPSRNKTLVIAAKNYAKPRSNLFALVQFCLISLWELLEFPLIFAAIVAFVLFTLHGYSDMQFILYVLFASNFVTVYLFSFCFYFLNCNPIKTKLHFYVN